MHAAWARAIVGCSSTRTVGEVPAGPDIAAKGFTVRTQRFDLLVLGTGGAGSSVATACREGGMSVAIVDERPFGGTCQLRGCDPKKVLVGVSEAVDATRRLRGKGVDGKVSIRWPELMRFKRTFTDPVPDARQESYSKAGIVALRGTARFLDSHSVDVAGQRIEARYVHIATGAAPVPLPIEGAEHLTTSDDFLELEQLPRTILFLGSGYIAFELAHVAVLAGAQVTMVEKSEMPLSHFDPDLVTLLAERTRLLGIELRTETTAVALERNGHGLVLHVESGGQRSQLQAEMVVHAAGRAPNLSELDLQAAGVLADEGGILVNPFLQSVSNPVVYAAGDAAKGGLPLTPVASLEAQVVAANLIEGNHRRVDYPPIPSVVFTQPPLASVGLSERAAAEQGLRVQVHHAKTGGWYSARRLGGVCAAHKVIVEEGSGRIVGAHVLGPGADELINLFVLAMRAGLTAREVKAMTFAYPTRASDLAHMM